MFDFYLYLENLTRFMLVIVKTGNYEVLFLAIMQLLDWKRTFPDYCNNPIVSESLMLQF